MDIQTLYIKIASLPSLSPSRKTNYLFSKLVEVCHSTKTSHLLSDKNFVDRLRTKSSIAESEMEKYWAKKIIASKTPTRTLKSFWYYKNYENLVAMELAALKQKKVSFKTILFIGGGPLPLTAILLAKKNNLHCTIIEKDIVAYSLAKKLISSLDLQDIITVERANALKYKKYFYFDIVFVAALAGISDIEKQLILDHLYRNIKKKSYVCCRSADNVKKLLYPEVTKAMLCRFKIIAKIIPKYPVINSVFILQKR